MLSKGDPKSVKNALPDIDLPKNSYKASYLLSPSLKKSFCFVNGKYGDLFGCLDLARIADWIVFVLPGDLRKIDMDNFSEIMTALYAQGLPPSVFVIMSNISDRKELLSLIEAKFSVEDGKVRTLNSSSDAQSLLRFLSQSQKKPPLSSANSYLATKNALKVGTAASRLRSGMLVESISVEPHEENEGDVYLKVEGLLRGWDMPLFDLSSYFRDQKRSGCPYIHVTGWGDFPLRWATWREYKPNHKPHQPTPQTFTWKATSESDEHLADALTAAWDNLQLEGSDEEYEDLEDEESVEFEEDEEMSVDEKEDNEKEFGNNATAPLESDDDESVYFDVDESEATSIKGGVTFNNVSEVTEIPSAMEKLKAAKAELLFPDEVETPHDISARERFVKYRGIPSFSECIWPTENDTSLPFEYSKIFRFGKYAHNRRTLFKYTLKILRELASEENKPAEPTHIPSGSVVNLALGPIPQALGASIMECHTDAAHPRPLTLWSLLPYERCMSVLHLTMHKRQSERQEYEAEMKEVEEEGKGKNGQFDPDPIMAKEPMLFQVGIRRFTTNPIYSQPLKRVNSNSKMERFFTFANSPIVATMYAPVIYAPQTALQFRIEPAECGNKMRLSNLIATGSVHSVDPTRAIVKRILLSGHPYKINKRSAVIRYMFHTPEDVEYFKPIQMYTKSGAVGHIKQSVGTHGLMKCLFDRQLIASDVVLMPLYKRVFPKMTFRAQVTAELANAEELVALAPPPQHQNKPLQGILKSTKQVVVDEDVPMRSSILSPEEEALFS
nr:pre rRNA processing protein TSR1 [Hymenolepis microstoma]